MNKTEEKPGSFDCIIIGSSPLSLMEAVYRARKGDRVKLVEKDSRLGGVWKTGSALGLSGIETTPHLFAPDRRGYQIMRELLPHDYVELQIQPIMRHRHSRVIKPGTVPMDGSFTFGVRFSSLNRIDNPAYGRYKRYRRYLELILTNLVRSIFDPRSAATIYPRNGIDPWIADIAKLLDSLGIDVALDTTVKMVSEIPDGVRLEYDRAGSDECRQVVLSGHTQLDRIEADDGPISIRMVPTHSHHFVFIVSGQEPLGPVFFHADDELFLANDVTDYAPLFRDKYRECRLITFRSKNSEPTSPGAEHYFEILKAAGYLAKTAILVDHSTWHLTQHYMHTKSVDEISKSLGKKVKFLTIDDLGITTSMVRFYRKRRR